MNVLQQFIQSNWFKISFYNACSLVVKLLVSLISSKAIAYFLGPTGLVLTANLRNLMSISENLGLMGLQNAIVIEIAQNKDNPAQLQSVLQNLFIYFLFISIGIGLILMLFFNFFAQELLLENYKFIIFWAAFFVPFQVFYVFYLQILNGLEEFKKLYLTHIFSNIIYVVISVFLMWKYSILGGLYSVLIAPFIYFWVVYYFLKPNKKNIYNFKTFDFKFIKSLFPITIMMLFTTVFSQLTLLEIRKSIVENVGMINAANWEAMQRISGIYMLFFSSLITIYYLPKIAQNLTGIEYKKTIQNFYSYLIPFVIVTFLVIFILKNLIIIIVLDSKFLGVNQLFMGQLIGDFFKIASSILALQFFIRKETKMYLFSEAISLIVYLFLSEYFLNHYQEKGVTFAYAISNSIYFVVVVLYRFYHKKQVKLKTNS